KGASENGEVLFTQISWPSYRRAMWMGPGNPESCPESLTLTPYVTITCVTCAGTLTRRSQVASDSPFTASGICKKGTRQTGKAHYLRLWGSQGFRTPMELRRIRT